MSDTNTARTFINAATVAGTPVGTTYGNFSGSYYLGTFEADDHEGTTRVHYVLASVGPTWVDIWHTDDSELIVWEEQTEHTPVADCPIDARTRAAIVAREHNARTYQNNREAYRTDARELRATVRNLETERNQLAATLAETERDRNNYRDNAHALGMARAWEKFQNIGRETAEAAGFCNEYERVGEAIAERLGLEFFGREKDWDVSVEIGGITITVSTIARSESEARDNITDDDVRNALRNYLDNSWNSIPDWTAESAEIS